MKCPKCSKRLKEYPDVFENFDWECTKCEWLFKKSYVKGFWDGFKKGKKSNKPLQPTSK